MSGSTTVFLKPMDLSTLPGYLAELCHPDRGRSWTKVTVAGFEVLGGNDSPRVSLYGSKDVPEVFREHVVQAITQEIFTSNPRRERGRYTLGDAHGLLELTNSNKEYNFLCEGPTVASCMDLVEAVKAGTIRPTVSYEQVQGGKSAQELERELMAVGAEVTRKSDELTDLRACLRACHLALSGIPWISRFFCGPVHLQMIEDSRREARARI